MKIRIVFIITGLGTGGAEMMLYKLLSRIDRVRFEPIVISLMETGTSISSAIAELGVSTHSIDMVRGQLSLPALWRLTRKLRSLRPHIVQGWMYHGNLASSLSKLLSMRRLPIVWNIRHAVHDLSYDKKLTRTIIRSSALLANTVEKIIYNARLSAQQHEALKYPGDRAVVIPNGFDCAMFKPSPAARGQWRRSLNIAQDAVLIGLIGRFDPMKDHANFFKAAGILASEHDGVRFVLAGSGMDKNNAAAAELINHHQLKGRVHLLGERRDTAELTAALDIATSSSYSEAFSNVIGEAMACAVPCVVTDVGDSRWLVGETGEVVPPRDADALAAAWASLIRAGREQRLRRGGEARRRILASFSLDKIVDQYEALYMGILARQRASFSRGSATS